MNKRDWTEVKRREKAAAGGENASVSPQSPSSSSRSHTQASKEDPEASACHPEMDEMRCLLWAHRGLDPYLLCPGSPGCLQVYPFHAGGFYFGSADQERYSTLAMSFACSSQGPENADI